MNLRVSTPHIVLIISIVLLSSGCVDQLEGPLSGLKNIGCLITADINCLKSAYVDKPPVDQSSTPNLNEPSDEYGIEISDIQFPSTPEGFSVPVTIELQNLAGFSEGKIKGYHAEDVKTTINVTGKFTAILTRNYVLNLSSQNDKSLLDDVQKSGFRCRNSPNQNGFTSVECTREQTFSTQWTNVLNWGTLIEGQRDILSFEIPSSVLSPHTSESFL